MPAQSGGPPKGTRDSVTIMSYIRKPNRGRPGALGDLASTITSIANTVGIANDLANDPYLPETVCRVGQLRDINQNKKPPVCVRTADHLPGGIGLRKFVKPLRGYVYAEQHKWVYAAGVAAIIGLPFLIGYSFGKGSR